MAAKALKKPGATAAAAEAPKTTKGKGAAKASAAKGKGALKAPATKERTPKKAGEAKFEVPGYAIFKGYVEKPDDPTFADGQEVYLVESKVETAENGDEFRVYTAIRPEDKIEFEANPENPEIEGEEVSERELSKLRGKPKSEENMPTRDVGELPAIIEANGSYLDAALFLNAEVEKNYFYLGGVLSHLFKEDEFRKIDNGKYSKATTKAEDWDTFCQDYFGFKGRKGRYLLDTYDTLSRLPSFDPTKIETAGGWSKVAEVARYATDENVNTLLDEAAGRSLPDLREHLQTEYTTEGKTASGREATRGTVKKTSYAFRLYESGAETVNYVLEEAKKQLGTDDLNTIFETIVVQWGEQHLPQTKAKKVGTLARKAAKAAPEAAASAAPLKAKKLVKAAA